MSADSAPRWARPRDPYALAHPEITRRFLEAAGDLAEAVLKTRTDAETILRRRIKKSRLTLNPPISETEETGGAT